MPPSSVARLDSDWAHVEMGVLKQYEFQSSLQRMSVLAVNTGTRTVTAYAKGKIHM